LESGELCGIALVIGTVVLAVLLFLLLRPRQKMEKDVLMSRLEWFYILIAMATLSVVVAVWMLTWS
jgi:H+/Cl- antiporter ClcA